MENRFFPATLVFCVLLVSKEISIDAKGYPKFNMKKVPDGEHTAFPAAAGKKEDAKLMEGFPGTKWCGTIIRNIPDSGNDLGDLVQLDVCCKAHNLCPLHIGSGKTRWGLKNDKDYTVRDCTCSLKFQQCLRKVEESSQHWAEISLATVLGNVYFNALNLPCISFEVSPDPKAKKAIGNEGAKFTKQVKWENKVLTKERKEKLKEMIRPKPTVDMKKDVTYPGTNWCGLGDVDAKVKDLGYYKKVDECCRKRNNWFMLIPPKMEGWGLKNDGENNIFECSSEDRLYRSLKKVAAVESPYFVQRYVADSFGSLFFDILATQCVNLDILADPPVGKLRDNPSWTT